MKLKGYVEEDFSNYKYPSMLLAAPTCTFKCGTLCQNLPLAKSKTIEYDMSKLIDIYSSNNITKSIVFGGLEPMDSFDEVLEFIDKFRKTSNDDIIIYTGFYEDEVYDKILLLSQYKNIIVKFGRFIPNEKSHYDELLGVDLASNNQYSRRIS